jgi:multidrug efflux pump subunit AcrA (membrane-fusion protein)
VRPGVELVERGLAALSDEQSVSELEAKLATTRSEREQTRARLQQAELGLQAAREREQLTARTYSALAERTRQTLGSCPRCRAPLRGSDLLVAGRCPNCGTALTALLLPAPQANLPADEYLALLGALAVLVGLALASSGKNAN